MVRSPGLGDFNNDGNVDIVWQNGLHHGRKNRLAYAGTTYIDGSLGQYPLIGR